MKTISKTQEKILKTPSPCLKCKTNKCGKACKAKFIPWFTLKWQTIQDIFKEEDKNENNSKSERKMQLEITEQEIKDLYSCLECYFKECNDCERNKSRIELECLYYSLLKDE